MTQERFGNVLRQYRDYRGLSQPRLAESAGGMSHSHISRLESGERNPTREMVLQIAKALGFHQGDARLNRMLEAAGFQSFSGVEVFACPEIQTLNQLYFEANEETKIEIRQAVSLLARGINRKVREESS